MISSDTLTYLRNRQEVLKTCRSPLSTICRDLGNYGFSSSNDRWLILPQFVNCRPGLRPHSSVRIKRPSGRLLGLKITNSIRKSSGGGLPYGLIAEIKTQGLDDFNRK